MLQLCGSHRLAPSCLGCYRTLSSTHSTVREAAAAPHQRRCLATASRSNNVSAHRDQQQQYGQRSSIGNMSLLQQQQRWLSSPPAVGSTAPCRIGCASGFWGDTPTAVRQLVSGGRLDYLILDYLSEITMSLLTAAKAKDPSLGYAPDFVLHAMGPNLKLIKEKGVRVVTNAGGINPSACAAALQAAAAKAGVQIKVGVVTGDDLTPLLPQLAGAPDLSTGEPLPAKPHSINAYTGAGPIVRALELGADVVVTGRAADSALALAPAAFHHGWELSSLPQVAGASVAGHLLECGAQATGGNHTDWRAVQGWGDMGFPIASISASGQSTVSRPPGTGGLLARGAVCEQLLYEVGDPRCYLLPDLALDITGVTVGDPAMGDHGEMGVTVQGARGLPPTDTYKVGATYLSGYKATVVCCLGGPDAAAKGRITALSVLERTNRELARAGVAPITRYHLQMLGEEESYGPQARSIKSRESVMWLSVQHSNRAALALLGREVAAAGTGGVPGLMGLIGGRPKPSPVLKLHSSLVNKKDVPLTVTVGDHSEEYVERRGDVDHASYSLPHQPHTPNLSLRQGNNTYRLEDLAFTRSGDKGDSCNIGVVARHPAFLPYLQHHLTPATVASYFQHLLQPRQGEDCVDLVSRYEVPGIAGLNFVLSSSLGGGGVASLRPDPQGKAYAQMMLDMPLQDMLALQDITGQQSV